ncbi:hypothetical protein HP499_21340 [Paenarthrobacter sp. CM16]|uniref:hypothetical protein n=1 Tax=Paenarthrobacter sp. CM16 TaxID=2738447 RepID=UPI001555D894|nr:hypothetical protein [Paenarthrobacter sp. CM16]NQD90335.1 hypothetical protein [Paenarthrobacter sp. CM16]
MTYRDTEREAIVDELLLDADLADASDVRQALVSLGAFANLSAPAPSPELAAMIAGPHDELSKRRWRHQHRTAMVSIAVVAAMGLGVSGVAAASSGFTRNPSFIDQLISNFQPQPPVAAPELPSPDAPRVSTEPAPAADPAPASDPASVPSPSTVQSIPVPAAASADNAAQAPVVPAAPAPKPANPALPNPALPNPAQPHHPVQAPAPEPQARLNQTTQRVPDATNVEVPKTDTGKPAKSGTSTKQGTSVKQGPLHPSASEKRTEEEFQSVMDKWKKWLKQGHR